MLVLTRRTGQSIQIDSNIRIDILAISKNQVRLGFTAPKSVSIHRQEVYQRLTQEKQGYASVIELPLASNQDR